MRSTTHELPELGETHHGRTLRTLAPYLWPAGEPTLKARVLLAILFLVGAKSVTIAVPVIYKEVVAALTGPESAFAGGSFMGDAASVPVYLILGYGLARLAAPAFGEIRDAIFANVGQRALRQIALRVFRHLHSLSMRFHLDRQTGGLSRVVERGTQGVDFLLRFMLFNIIPTLFEIAVVFGLMWSMLGFRYAAAMLIAVAGYIIFTFAITEWRIKYRREMNRQDTEANTKAIDSLLNFETVKYYGNEEHEAGRYDRAMQRYERAAIKSQATLSALNIGQNTLIAGGLAVVMLMSAYDLRAGRHGIDDFVFVNMILAQLFMPLGFLGFVYREMKRALIDMEAMFDLMEEPCEVIDKPGAQPLRMERADIAFDHVSFSYDPDRGILHDLSFRVPGGHTLAIVGHSGAGKSTISRLLFRFYDVNSGAIMVDGQNITDVTQESLRAAIGVVPQDTVLFNDTIGYNIRYGRPGASEEEVIDAAKLASIHDFITSLPKGYDTRVGERGLKVSGGEKQRIAIARTILKNPPILLLDEATSALDTNTEKEIQAALQAVSANRTTLIIAHRLSTVVHAEEILVLDHGRVVERGSHAALVAIPGGAYETMWRKQQEAVAAAKRLEDLSVALETG